MRITIEIDEKTGSAATSSAPETQVAASAPSVPAAPSLDSPPSDVLALAAASGAINAGPAPTSSGSTDSAPHPFVSSGATPQATPAAALSAGSAAQAKPCS